MKHLAALLFVLLSGLSHTCDAQQNLALPVDKTSRIHLSWGRHKINMSMPDEVQVGKEPATKGWRAEGLCQLDNNLLLGASVYEHHRSGGQWFPDSSWTTVDMTGYVPDPTDFLGLGAMFYAMGAPHQNFEIGDAILIDQRIRGLDLLAGYLVPVDHPRHLVHFTHRFTAGLGIIQVMEDHAYIPNVVCSGEPTLGFPRDPEVYERTTSMGMSFVLQYRCDLHVSRFFSVFAALDLQAQLGRWSLPGSTFTNAEGQSVQLLARTANANGGGISGGLAIHF